MCTEPSDVASLPSDVLDGHVVVVSYGGEDVQIVYDARAGVPGLKAAVAAVSDVDPTELRARLLAPDAAPALDEAEAALLGRLDVAMVDALEAEASRGRRAVLAGYVLVALRRELRARMQG